MAHIQSRIKVNEGLMWRARPRPANTTRRSRAGSRHLGSTVSTPMGRFVSSNPTWLMLDLIVRQSYDYQQGSNDKQEHD